MSGGGCDADEPGAGAGADDPPSPTPPSVSLPRAHIHPKALPSKTPVFSQCRLLGVWCCVVALWGHPSFLERGRTLHGYKFIVN